MSKFKVGDKVRGTCEQNNPYAISHKNARYPFEVIQVFGDYMRIKVHTDDNHFTRNNQSDIILGHPAREYEVQSKYFELVKAIGIQADNGLQSFQVGDIVEAFGIKGKILEIRKDDYVNGPIICLFEDKHVVNFDEDGKAASWHKISSLKLIERPAKETKFTARVCAGGLNTGMLENISELEHFVGRNVEVTVKVKE